ncbi:DNA mismatch repair protein, C-terminal domain protein [delta proteobacterium NaphS2]|nr:DNA mismatch repair protein, C-terminal domain protein [delta proteobacterium NaphS2]
MNTIRILPEKIASQIAAGEVIERPASVVRELIDNSIDARADRISIKTERGGKGLIRVSDNGIGMGRDDLLLCLERHATSKIKIASDLSSVTSFGFRGEAIPSIAAVSRLEITSLPDKALLGNRVTMSGGKLLSVEEVGAPQGTIVAVKNLFFNMPARRKFLKTPRTEMNHIVDAVLRAAMPFRKISFRLEEGEREIFHLPASSNPSLRLSHLMDRMAGKSLLSGENSQKDLHIAVHAAPAEFARKRADRLFVYVNGRNIKDRFVTKAIIEGYGQRLMKGRYPQALVFITIDPAQIDVNVHPAKQEIKFQNGQQVFRAVAAVVHQTLKPAAHLVPKRPEPFTNLKSGEAPQSAPSIFKTVEPYVPATVREPPPAPIKAPSMDFKAPEIIGQLGNMYILCQMDDGLLLVDQHAAHERIVYETLQKSLRSANIEIQNLLLPYEMEFSLKEKGVLLEKGHVLAQLGIELDHFGGNTFLLRSVPALLKDVNWQMLISEFISKLDEGVPLEGVHLTDEAIKIMACHGAIRAGQHLTPTEMSDLVRQLSEMDLPTNCPHGRPIFKSFTYFELSKMFKRIV